MFFRVLKDIRDQLKSIDGKMEEEDLVILTLKSFPSSIFFIETLNITSSDELPFDQLSNKPLTNLAIRFCRETSGRSNLKVARTTSNLGVPLQ